jgi:hypothetical protein
MNNWQALFLCAVWPSEERDFGKKKHAIFLKLEDV